MTAETSGGGDSREEPGSWSSIDAACARVHGPAKPLHVGTVLPYALGGPDPIDGISMYPRDDHWHFVTYGFSELHADERNEDGSSGFGFELTMRVEDLAQPKSIVEENWAERAPVLVAHVALLQHLGRYVFGTRNVLRPFETMQVAAPDAVEPSEAKWAGVLFCPDTEMPPIDTPSGHVEFVQVVGLSPAEFRAAQLIGGRPIVEMLRESDPLLVSRLSRPCRMDDPEFAARVAEHLAKHGSTRNAVAARGLDVRSAAGTATIRIPRAAAERLRDGLEHVLPFGRDFAVVSNPVSVRFVPADVSEESLAAWPEPHVSVRIGRDEAQLLARAFPAEGTTWRHPAVPSVVVEFVEGPAVDAVAGRGAERARQGCAALLLAAAVSATAGLVLAGALS